MERTREYGVDLVEGRSACMGDGGCGETGAGPMEDLVLWGRGCGDI